MSTSISIKTQGFVTFGPCGDADQTRHRTVDFPESGSTIMLGLILKWVEQIGLSVLASWKSNGNGSDPLGLN